MNDEIKEIELWKEKTKGIFHITEYTRFWNYITNLQQENERKERLITQYGEGMCAYANRIEKAIEYMESTTFFGIRSGKTFMSKYLNDLLNILQNGSEEK